jgi:hypothetical protein
MKTKKIILVALIAIILVLTLVIFLNLAREKTKETIKENQKGETTEMTYEKAMNSKNIDNCSYMKDEEEKKACTSNLSMILAQEKTDERYCESEICKLLVLYRKVENTGNVELCQELGDKSVVQECKDEYYFTAAKTKKDITLCDKMSEGKEECKKQFLNK